MEMLKFTRDSPIQRIKAWYINEDSVELSENDKKYKDRLYHMWCLLAKNAKTRLQAIDIIAREHGVSDKTAYRDYHNSQIIFGDFEATNAAAQRMIYKERYELLYQMAIKQGNIEAARKINDSLVALLPPISDGNKVDPEKLQKSVYKLNLPRGAGRTLEALAATGVMDFNNISAEDVTWKDVEENNDNEDEEVYE